MSLLYKYLPVERVDVVENMNIRFSPLSSLNDPFESRPLICVDDMARPTLDKALSEVEGLWESLPSSEKTEENLIYKKNAFEAVEAGYRSTTSPSIIGRDLVSTLGDKFGILSLSRNYDSLLMWSHYASSGAGYVIGLDSKNSFLNRVNVTGALISPKPIIYSSQRSVLKFFEENFIEKFIFRKPLEWCYEEEERLYVTFSENYEGEVAGVDQFDNDVYLSELPRDLIKVIYLGGCMTEEHKARLIKAVRKNCDGCKVFNASISKTEYKLEINELVVE